MNQPKPMPESFIVRGIVVTNVGVAAKGLKVIAFDYSPGKEVLLGGPISDSSGTYTISYTKGTVQERGKHSEQDRLGCPACGDGFPRR